MNLERDPFVILLGGEINPDKFMMLSNLIPTAFRIILLGEFGLAAFLNDRNLDEF